MLEYVFVLDGTRGASLLVMTFMLVVFALDVPALLAFSVARYQNPHPERAPDLAVPGLAVPVHCRRTSLVSPCFGGVVSCADKGAVAGH